MLRRFSSPASSAPGWTRAPLREWKLMAESETKAERQGLKVRVKKMSEVIADQLRAKIARGEISGGDVLPNERLLQEEFGVSRPTLREAMRILEVEGLLVTPRGGSKGAQITSPSSKQAARYAGLILQVRGTTLADIFALRTLVEPAAARALAEMPVRPDLAPLRDLLVKASKVRDLRQLTLQMNAFDRALLELTGNEALRLVGEMISHIISLHLHTIPDNIEGVNPARLRALENMLEQFDRILDAIEAGDADLTEELMKVRMREREAFQQDRSGERLNVVG